MVNRSSHRSGRSVKQKYEWCIAMAIQVTQQ
jgi:hypothetical protein